jgi:methylenetetrahydrofolate reductase (NADPH)
MLTSEPRPAGLAEMPQPRLRHLRETPRRGPLGKPSGLPQGSAGAGQPFELWCEIQSSVTPDLDCVGRQVQALRTVADGYLVTDNHLGRPTVSSLVGADEVIRHGGRPMACLNARDRNLLGFQRDLLTAGALQVDQLLLVHGDKPVAGSRTGSLRVREMLEDAHAGHGQGTRIGVTCRLEPLPAWKRDADFLFVQLGFSLADLVRWRETVCFDGPIYAGVLVLASAAMGQRLTASVPQIQIPDSIVRAVERDPSSGMDIACDLIDELAAAGGFAGVHLVSGVRSGSMAARLGTRRWVQRALEMSGGPGR